MTTTTDIRIQDLQEQIATLKAAAAAATDWATFEEITDEIGRLHDRIDAIEADLDDPYREDPVGYVPQTWWKAKNARQIELRRIWSAMKTGQV